MGSDVPRIGVHGEVLPKSRLQRKADLNLHLPSMGKRLVNGSRSSGTNFGMEDNKLNKEREKI